MILPTALLPLNCTRYCMLHRLWSPSVTCQMSPAIQIQVERGLSFSDAVNLLNTEIYPGEGFYISKKVCMNTCFTKVFIYMYTR